MGKAITYIKKTVKGKYKKPIDKHKFVLINVKSIIGNQADYSMSIEGMDKEQAILTLYTAIDALRNMR